MATTRSHAPVAGVTAFNFTTVGGGNTATSVTETLVTGLRPNVNYDVILQAFNAKGSGPTSRPVIGRTQQDS